MAASTEGVDGPTERHPRFLGHAVEHGFRPHLVKPRVECLGCVEVADHRGLAISRQRRLFFPGNAQVFPAHEHMFAYWAAELSAGRLAAGPSAAGPAGSS